MGSSAPSPVGLAREISCVLTEWLQMCEQGANDSAEMKTFILGLIERSGSLEYTRRIMHAVHIELTSLLGTFEHMTGQKNWLFRSILTPLQPELDNQAGSKKESTLDRVLRVWGGYQDEAWRSILN
ncbi:hypothetical protein ABHI18_012648 [Aspergillus niger]